MLRSTSCNGFAWLAASRTYASSSRANSTTQPTLSVSCELAMLMPRPPCLGHWEKRSTQHAIEADFCLPQRRFLSRLVRNPLRVTGYALMDERRLRERLQTLIEAGVVRSWSSAHAGGGLQNYYKLTPLGFERLYGV